VKVSNVSLRAFEQDLEFFSSWCSI